MPRKSNIGPLPPARRTKPPRKPVFKKYSRRPTKPDLEIYTILAWADEHHARTGRWPTAYSGEVLAARWEAWRCVDHCLRGGCRGCKGHSSLALLLNRHRGVPLRPPAIRLRLTIRQILTWADAYHARHGAWPAQKSPGPVGPLKNWVCVDRALRGGLRGLRGGDSLAQVLMRHRGVRRARYRPRLSIEHILACADRFHARHGDWPDDQSGPVEGSPGDTWMAFQRSLVVGCRDLPGGESLPIIFQKHRGVLPKYNTTRYAPRQILAWADAFYREHEHWPHLNSGPIPGAPGETWLKVEGALSKGRRGLPGGNSLARFLSRHGRAARAHWDQHAARHAPLTTGRILAWADAYFRQHGRWPATHSGRIAGTSDETWLSVDTALRQGMRGLSAGSSIALLLERERGARHKHHRPKLTPRAILAWADDHYRRAALARPDLRIDPRLRR